MPPASYVAAIPKMMLYPLSRDAGRAVPIGDAAVSTT